jgi:hypothetical protein
MPTEAERPGPKAVATKEAKAVATKEATAAPIFSIRAPLELLMERRLKRDLTETQYRI